ncbi:hypothetical protein MJN76_34370, partial [Salmonella enterica subsp. enterica serovar Anatum]|nr:hypothetical protein [Salmonella enterica subsp. enterica serovar Anatum]
DKCMNFHADNLSLHENGMRITALAGDKVLYSQTYYSIGGGFIAAFAHRCEVAYITLSSFRVNPEFQDFSLQPTGCLCEVIHIRR